MKCLPVLACGVNDSINEWMLIKIVFRMQSTSAISNTHYLELSLYQTFCLVSSPFSLTSLISPFSISNHAISNFYYVEQLSRSLQSFFRLSYATSRTFEWGSRINHTVHFRHSNVSHCIEKLCSEVYSFFFSTLFRQQHVLS